MPAVLTRLGRERQREWLGINLVPWVRDWLGIRGMGSFSFWSKVYKFSLSFIHSPFLVKRSTLYGNTLRSISEMAANISVSPRSSLMDCKVKIFISGLEAGQRVTLHASVVGDAKEIFESHAYYIANKQGKLKCLSVTSGKISAQLILY